MRHTPRASRWVALTLVATLSLPMLGLTAGCGNNKTATESNGGPMVNNAPLTPDGQPTATQAPKAGLTTKQKVVLVAGAALLFYLYKRYKAQDAAAAQAGGQNGHPQLYREEKGPNKGAIYYRKNDAAHTVVWLKAPAQGMQIPADQVQQYLPDYNTNPNAYQGQVNTNPQPGVMGGTVESADQYATAGGPPGPGG